MNDTILASKEADKRRTGVVGGKAPVTRSLGLAYEVCINSVRSGRFDDVSDAIASARMAKSGQPFANVVVADTMTGRMVIEVEQA